MLDSMLTIAGRDGLMSTYFYVTFFLIAVGVLIQSMLNDSDLIVSYVYGWKTMLPSHLLAAYITWIMDYAVRSASSILVRSKSSHSVAGDSK